MMISEEDVHQLLASKNQRSPLRVEHPRMIREALSQYVVVMTINTVMTSLLLHTQAQVPLQLLVEVSFVLFH